MELENLLYIIVLPWRNVQIKKELKTSDTTLQKNNIFFGIMFYVENNKDNRVNFNNKTLTITNFLISVYIYFCRLMGRKAYKPKKCRFINFNFENTSKPF